QIEDCVVNGAQAVIIGAISYDGLNNLVKEVAGKKIPVIDVINGMSSADISAKSLVSFGEMGFKAGEYIAKLHPKGSGKVKVAWFPGPPGAGGAERRSGDPGPRRHRPGGAHPRMQVLSAARGAEALWDRQEQYRQLRLSFLARSRRLQAGVHGGLVRYEENIFPLLS